MGLLDRIRPQPPWQHADPHVRAEALDALTDDQAEVLVTLARTDPSAIVRRAALDRIHDAHVLAEMARDDGDDEVRGRAAERLLDAAIPTSDESVGLAAADVLVDPKLLATLARSASLESVAHAALARLADDRLIASVARRAAHPPVRLAALARLTTDDALTDVAMRSEHTDAALAALERLQDAAQLETIALRGRNKVASRRASARLRTLKQAAVQRPATSATRPRQIDLCERVERLIQDSQSDRVLLSLEEAQAAWAALVPDVDDDLADRFASACGASRDHLAALDAEQNARVRLDQATASQRSARRLLCEEAVAIFGADAPDRLKALRDRWTSLDSWNDPEAAALDRRFVEASAACEARHAAWLEARSTLERLSAAAEQLADDPAFPSDRDKRDQVAALRHEYRQLPETMIAQHPDLISRLAQADSRLRAREIQIRDRRAQEQRDALNRLERLAADAETQLAAGAPTLKDLERRHRDIKAALDQTPELPSKRDRDAIVARLKTVLASASTKVQELREAADWERWANAGVQESLCARAEALADVADPVELAKALQEIEQQWRQFANAPRERSQELWHRYQAAHQRVRARLQEHFAAQEAERRANLEKKLALCAQAEALQDSTDWLKTADAIKALQAEWKNVGAVGRGQEKAVWERFRQACDRFFTRRNEDLAKRKAVWIENAAKKEALCARAEACAESSDWDHAAAEIRKIQSEWRLVGPVRRAKAEVLWQRLHAATERFFDRYKQRDRLALETQLLERQRVRAEMEALAGVGPDGAAPVVPVDGVASALRRLIRQWESAGPLPRELAAELDAQFAGLMSAVVASHRQDLSGSEFDADRNRQTMEDLCGRVERLISPTAPADSVMSPSARLAAMLREALASNTIGGRVDEDAKWRAAAEDVKAAQSAWRRIGFVPEPVRSELASRFDRVCRNFFDQRRATSPPTPRPRPAARPRPERSPAKT